MNPPGSSASKNQKPRQKAAPKHQKNIFDQQVRSQQPEKGSKKYALTFCEGARAFAWWIVVGLEA
jgi:hypothetical protein